MIRYPATLDSLRERIKDEVPGWLASARRKTGRFRKLKRYSEESPTWSEVKPVFMELQRAKCAYCERKLEEGDIGKIEWDVEHFRPKSAVTRWPPRSQTVEFAFPLGPASQTGYYLLPYHPLNYLASCKVCNSPLKGDYFPIGARRRRLTGSDPRKLVTEQPYLIYPIGDFDDDPESLLSFQGFLCVPVADRGERRRRALVTIAFFRLNDRDTLLKERAQLILGTWVMLQRREADPADNISREYIEAIGTPGFRHANCARSFLRTYEQDRELARTFVERAREYCQSKGGC